MEEVNGGEVSYEKDEAEPENIAGYGSDQIEEWRFVVVDVAVEN